MGKIEESIVQGWEDAAKQDDTTDILNRLEAGGVIIFPALGFSLSEQEQSLLTPDVVDSKRKNVSFDSRTQKLSGIVVDEVRKVYFKDLMHRYATVTTTFVERMLPQYKSALQIGRTSFRPVEIQGRKSSYRKDDTRLHVDAFPSNPICDKRILRIFSNVHPGDMDRVWRVGEPFENVAKTFLPQVRKPLWAGARLLKLLKITKKIRSPYDHYMLHIHNRMKADEAYQQQAEQTQVAFPPGTTWMTFTDQVSHAAMSGQHVLEQTFYLPVDAMVNPDQAPLRVLEKLTGTTLVA